MDKCLPCPFCGCTPEWQEAEENGWWLGCMNCTIAPYLEMGAKEDCVRIWNERADSASEGQS